MIAAILGALAVGLSLGLLGSGGSILTIPALVYLLHQPTKLAIAGSLAIVGSIALIGAARYAQQGLVSWRLVASFGVPGVVATWGGAWLSQFVPGALQLAVFAGIMGVAAWGMLRPPAAASVPANPRPLPWLVVAGIGVGLVTGFVGVGGGFLLVPALVFLAGLGMHRAVATSLVVIVINSASGFLKHYEVVTAAGHALDWRVIGLFILVGGIGSLVGNGMARRVPQRRLRQVFGVFLIAMGGFILWRTIPELQGATGDRAVVQMRERQHHTTARPIGQMAGAPHVGQWPDTAGAGQLHASRGREGFLGQWMSTRWVDASSSSRNCMPAWATPSSRNDASASSTWSIRIV